VTSPDAIGGIGEQIAPAIPDLAFAEPASIDALRDYHYQWQVNARELEIQRLGDDSILEGVDGRRRADALVSPMIDEGMQNYVIQKTAGMPQELRDRFATLLPQFALNQMSDTEWYQGVENPDGAREPSGRERLHQAVDQLRAELGGGTPDPNTLSSPFTEALSLKRNELAKLDAKLALLIRDRSRKVQRAQAGYDEVQLEYKNLVLQHGEALAKQHRAQGLSGDLLHARITDDYLDEHTAFSNAKLEAMQNDNGLRARAARWLAGKGRLMEGLNMLGSFGTGMASKALLGGVLTAAGAATAGIAIPVGIATYAAVKGTQGAISGSLVNRVAAYRNHEGNQSDDLGRIKNESNALHFDGDHIVFTGKVADIMHKVRNDRIEASRRKNRRNVVKTIAISALSAVAGELVATYALPHFIGLFHHGHSTSAGNAQKQPGTRPTVPPTTPKPPVNHTYGFQPNITVPQGAGYDQMVTKLVAERGIHLDGAQSWLLYSHLQSTFGDHIFTNNVGYLMGPNANDLGISHAVGSSWNPAVFHEVNTWLAQHNLTDPVKNKVKKTVAKKLTQGMTRRLITV